jgi:hypothetical protein
LNTLPDYRYLAFHAGQTHEEPSVFNNPAANQDYSVQLVFGAGGDVQAAIDIAQCGDTIVLQAGATFRTAGPWVPFVLVAKPCGAGADDPYITIQSSNLALLPNGRVSPADRNNMAKIVALGPGGAFTAQEGAHKLHDQSESDRYGSVLQSIST